jgi:hypothetical protein
MCENVHEPRMRRIAFFTALRIVIASAFGFQIDSALSSGLSASPIQGSWTIFRFRFGSGVGRAGSGEHHSALSRGYHLTAANFLIRRASRRALVRRAGGGDRGDRAARQGVMEGACAPRCETNPRLSLLRANALPTAKNRFRCVVAVIRPADRRHRDHSVCIGVADASSMKSSNASVLNEFKSMRIL